MYEQSYVFVYWINILFLNYKTHGYEVGQFVVTRAYSLESISSLKKPLKDDFGLQIFNSPPLRDIRSLKSFIR